MNEYQSADPASVEDHQVTQGCFLENGNGVIGIEQKLHNTDCHGSHAPTIGTRHRTRSKDKSPLALRCAWLVEHQIGLSVNLLILLGLTHIWFPKARPTCRKFFQLSYYNQESAEYAIGWNDACMVLCWIVIFTGLRAFFLDHVLLPLAQHAGIRKKKDRMRFAEQAWLLMYCTTFWSLGMYTMYHSDYWLNLRNLWTNWPIREIDGLRKWYILVQSAFWLQQIIVINIEKRRKDYWQMFAHHIITCSLLFTSYGYYLTKVANVVLCLTDVVDLFFPAAKCLKYLGFAKLRDGFFGLFVASWVIARHALYLMVCFSLWRDIPIEIAYGCYKGKKGALIGPFSPGAGFWHLIEPFLHPQGTVCFDHGIKWAFLTGLLLLQGIMIMWFWMICKVAAKVVRGGQAHDSRSDEGEDDEELEKFEPLVFEKLEPVEVLPLGEEVGVEAINLTGRNGSARRFQKSAPSSSGVTLPGHSDRKELLGRIGCDKGI
ncbi:MAG: sphingosine N-acyltransferase lag1 [Claussenomyces sp. TS43310]|nr:MAG: sphingosine N-acyltransferase lag1 [Claussenomyces sp. TS43310]